MAMLEETEFDNAVGRGQSFSGRYRRPKTFSFGPVLSLILLSERHRRQFPMHRKQLLGFTKVDIKHLLLYGCQYVHPRYRLLINLLVLPSEHSLISKFISLFNHISHSAFRSLATRSQIITSNIPAELRFAIFTCPCGKLITGCQTASVPIGQERQGGEILNLMMDGRSKELEWCCITAVLTISRILASDDGGKMPKRSWKKEARRKYRKYRVWRKWRDKRDTRARRSFFDLSDSRLLYIPRTIMRGRNDSLYKYRCQDVYRIKIFMTTSYSLFSSIRTITTNNKSKS